MYRFNLLNKGGMVSRDRVVYQCRRWVHEFNLRTLVSKDGTGVGV